MRLLKISKRKKSLTLRMENGVAVKVNDFSSILIFHYM